MTWADATSAPAACIRVISGSCNWYASCFADCKGGDLMKNKAKKMNLNRETLRRLDARKLRAVKGGVEYEGDATDVVGTLITTVFSEGACDGYSWVYAC
ncbi:MAG: hypothetical protein HY698_16260 [Deltaproteobacteria bacterium]|nr:hypothetical protein [Deltaproteobacteria bacterium]